MVVEAFLVVSVASFHLSIMPWRSRSEQLVNDLQSCTLYVHGMNHLGFPEMGEFTSIVCLDNLWEVSEVGDCPANEIHSRVTAGFLVWIDEPLTRRFINHGVLIESLVISPGIAGCWDIFHVHLPLDARLRWCVIWFQVPGFLLGRWCFLSVAQTHEDTIQ